MSTYWYLECLDHSPVLSSDDEVEQHTRGLHVIIDMVDLRADYIKASTVADLDLGSFERKAFSFIRQHPTCRMQLKSEYGDVQALPSTHKPEPDRPAELDKPSTLTEKECLLPKIGWVACPNWDSCGNPKRQRVLSPWEYLDHTDTGGNA